jgi:GABA(A) receptor-associated protein
MTFKNNFNEAERKQEAQRILERYPDRVPIVVEKRKDNDGITDLDKHKYLVPKDMTLGQFVYVIRRRIKLKPEKAIFVFVNNVLPPVSQLISQLYEEHKDEDGFLYLTYGSENTFG